MTAVSLGRVGRKITAEPDASIGREYYLRARYMNPSNGRFTQMDAFSGFESDPASIHKYTYVYANPVSNRDPSGNVTLTEIGVSIGISVGFNLGITALGNDHSPQAFGKAAAWGVVEGLAFLGVGKVAARSVAELYQAAKSAYFMRQVRKTFSLVKGERLIPGFQHLYERMIVQTPIGKILLSSGSAASGAVTGALKHVVGEVLRRTGGAGGGELAEAVVIKEIIAIAKALPEAGIVANGVRPYLVVTTQAATWEVAVGYDAATGLMKIYHLVIKGWH